MSAREQAQATYDRADQLGENLVPSQPPAAVLMEEADEIRTYKPSQLPPDQRDQLQEDLVPGPAPPGQADSIRTYTNAQLPPDMRDNLQENLVPYPTTEAPDGKRTFYDDLPEGLRDHLGENFVPGSAPIPGDETESPV
ncbi:hypothetical protein HXX76_007748 [Chlamydomonas incerta]|uniref:Uncharacterized protein n=1 Tax=Chlamydomonas incerta TaxID=51695 RepID=A0A835T9I0_CHLIN|nr:hypothetical protein HXX76_007748 [Chlamydomonas incerta]|eukprot:KAG2434865.1 hypothetical protein HXX76_007748 [Chlamydomonas incerta]